MINIEEINNTINELIQGNTTFNSCEKLASLYIVKDHLENVNLPVIQANNNVVKEYKDILPDYTYYCDIKKKYQRGEVTETKVIECMSEVCTEIKEFISTLYSSTDMEEERDLIKSMLNSIEM